MAVDQRRLLLAIDRVLGLEPDPDATPIDFAAVIPEELRQIVLSFPQPEESVAPAPSEQRNDAVQSLAFTLGGQDFAVPIGSVEQAGVAGLLNHAARREAADAAPGADESH